MSRGSVLLVSLLFATALPGCVLDERPLLDLRLERSDIPADGALVANVSFENTANEPFTIRPADACLTYQVVVLGPDGQFIEEVATDQCQAEIVLQPGESLNETRIRMPFAERSLTEGPFFKPNVSYRVQVGIRGDTTWEVQTERTFRVVAAQAQPHLELIPESKTIVIGEQTRFHVQFQNGREPFTFTSRDGCPIAVYVETEDERIEFWLEDGPAFCTQATMEVRLEPGQTISGTVYWDGTTAWEDGEPVPPGEYTVHAVWDGWGHAWDANGTATVTVAQAEGQDATNDDRDEKTDDEQDRPRITIQPPSTTWSNEERVVIETWFHNTADATFHFTTPNTCAEIHVYAVNEQGSRQELWPEGEQPICGAAFTDHEVEPGGNLSTSVVWDPDRFGRGNHTIQATFEASSASWETDAQTRVTVT